MAIKRREFISGIATTLAAGSTFRPNTLSAAVHLAAAPGSNTPYPPSLTGLRGNHPGSFEAAHAMALGGQHFPAPTNKPDELYDLIVVGGGISGLAAAWFWRRQHPEARILILDNHDDFGGHAKRNEFDIDGKKLIGYGGSQSIDTPSHYSDVAIGLLRDLGIDTEKFHQYYDRDFSRRHHMGSRWFFDEDHYGTNTLTPNPVGEPWLNVDAPDDLEASINHMPLSTEARAALFTLIHSERDWLEGKSVDEKIAHLRSNSYEDYLREDCAMPEEVVVMLRNRSHGLWAVGYDAISALAAADSGEPGTTTLGLEEHLWGNDEGEPYIFHFPDGNAGIARLLVRELIPDSASGHSMEDIVTADLHYNQLDTDTHDVRIRLNALATHVQHNAEGNVDVVYQRHGQSEQVRAQRVIMACYNHIIPHICPDLPADQAEAMRWPEKAPLVYTNVALHNWLAFKKAGMYHFHAMRDFWVYGALDFPVSMPGYPFSNTPDDPIILHLVHVPTAPGKPAREQYREGRRQLLGMPFEDYEAHIRRQLSAMLGPYGFEFDQDVAAITVNRWPHGYAYEYIDLWDPADWGPDKGPHILARKAFGQIAIANSDSSAYAYVNGAIDAAWRAVNDLQSSGQS